MQKELDPKTKLELNETPAEPTEFDDDSVSKVRDDFLNSKLVVREGQVLVVSLLEDSALETVPLTFSDPSSAEAYRKTGLNVRVRVLGDVPESLIRAELEPEMKGCVTEETASKIVRIVFTNPVKSIRNRTYINRIYQILSSAGVSKDAIDSIDYGIVRIVVMSRKYEHRYVLTSAMKNSLSFTKFMESSASDFDHVLAIVRDRFQAG